MCDNVFWNHATNVNRVFLSIIPGSFYKERHFSLNFTYFTFYIKSLKLSLVPNLISIPTSKKIRIRDSCISLAFDWLSLEVVAMVG